MADERYYRVTLSYDPDHARFDARLPELDVEGKGETRADALADLEAAIEARVERAAVDGETLPAPLDETPPALELSLTLAPSVARELRFQAQRAGLSVEALATQLVAQGLGPGPLRKGAPARRTEAAVDAEAPTGPAHGDDRDSQPPKKRHHKGRRRRQEGYRPDIDDQANFLAYVRGMEKGGGGRGRGG
jgi:predicted RNase H-like HicB family nuclease